MLAAVQGRHDQQVGGAVQPASGTARSRIAVTSAASACISPSISSVGCARPDHRQRLAHLARRLGVAGAEAGMRHQCRLGRDAEAAHRFGRQQRHLGDLLRLSDRPPCGCRQMNSAPVGRITARQGVDPVHVGPARDDRQDVLDLPPPVAGAAADRRVGLAGVQQHRGGDRRARASRRAAASGGDATAADQALVLAAPAARTPLVASPGSSTRTSLPRSRRSPMSRTLAAITSRRPSRIGAAMPSSTSIWAARRMRSSSPSAKTMRRFGAFLRRLEHRAHQLAGAEHEAFQVAAIGGEVGDRPARDAAVHGGAGDGGGDLQDQPRIERLRNDVVGTEHRRGAAIGRGHHLAGLHAGQAGDRFDRGDLHRLVDRGGGDVQRAAEDEREAQDVVDLVRIVAAAGGDDGVRAGGAGQVRVDLRLGVGQRQDQRPVGELRQPLRLQHAAARTGPGRRRRRPAPRQACVACVSRA